MHVIVNSHYLTFGYGILLVLSTTQAQSSKTPVGTTEFCQSEYFTAQCDENEVVVMDKAKYGRMRINRCVKENFGYIGCGRDVLEHMDSRCSGRRECSIRVLDEVFDTIQPCHDDLKSYLYATYNCVAVAHPEKSSCRSYKAVTLSGPSGYIASIVSEESGCGSADTPWIIQVQAGQRISIFLSDFALRTNGTAAVTSHDYVKVCRVYATLRESTSTRSVTVCGGRERTQQVYSSSTSQVEMRILNSKTPHKPVYFMFKYEAVGCPILNAPQEGWIQQDHDVALVGCNGRDETWKLRCNGTEWEGVLGNCSKSVADTVTGPQDLSMSSLSFEISVMVVILLAITIGLLVLALGLFCMRKHSVSLRRRNQPRACDESSGDESGREFGPKTILAPHGGILHPTTIISCPRDCNFRENEYASMRLLHPDHVCDHENIVNHTRDPRRTDTYGNPQMERHEPKTFETYPPHTDSAMTSEYTPQFLDIDPDAFHMQIREVHISSTLPTRGGKQGNGGAQTKSPPGKDAKFSIVDSFGTTRKAGQRGSYPGDSGPVKSPQCPTGKCIT